MAITLNLTKSDVLTSLRSFLLAILPSGIEVVRGLDNRVPEPDSSDDPAGTDFVTMTPIMQTRQSTTNQSYFDSGSTAGTQTDSFHNEYIIQIDVHGPNCANHASIIEGMFRSSYGVILFQSFNDKISSTYISSSRLLPFVNAEQQVERRYSIDVILDTIPSVTIDVADYFADTATITQWAR